MPSLRRFVTFREGEAVTAWLMFSYSFFAMTAYNIVKPATRATFIDALGADNLPWVQLGAAVLIGAMVQAYTGAAGRLPRRSVIPVTQLLMAGSLLVFWGALHLSEVWAPAALFVFGLLMGLLLISQFWTLANDIYDARQARRLFGFIGGGASLGGVAAGALTAQVVGSIGTMNLLPLGALFLLCSVASSWLVVQRRPHGDMAPVGEHRGVSLAEAVQLLGTSRHLRIITLVIACAAIGATLVEQQLNMAAEASRATTDDITRFLAEVTFYVSLAGFIIQVGVTGRLHRAFGLVFALLLLPATLGTTAMLILVSGAPWAPALARVFDTSLRYTVDKTTREMLFLPLPATIRYRAKPFLDITVDRLARGAAAIALLVLIKPWGLGLDWPQVSYASLAVMSAWIALSLLARREYLRAFRHGLDHQALEPATVRFEGADASTIKTLVDELARPDEDAVIYAIDMLETLGRLELVTPLLLRHESPRVRARVLAAVSDRASKRIDHWRPALDRMLNDPHPLVRAAAVRAVGRHGVAAEAGLRAFLEDPEPRVAVEAAVELLNGADADDAAAAEATLSRLAADQRPMAAAARRDVAAALARVSHAAARTMLISLMHDPVDSVARQAMLSVRSAGAGDPMFVPALIARLGHRQLKAAARSALVASGPSVVPVLAHFMADEREAVWVRRHVPATLAGIPSQASMDALVAALGVADGFLRFKAIEGIEALSRAEPSLRVPRAAVEQRIVGETGRYNTYLTLRANLRRETTRTAPSLLERALEGKERRTLDRIYRLLGILHGWKDIAAARQTIERGDQRARASALEFLDNTLTGSVRKRVIPILEPTSLAEQVRHANHVLKSRPRDAADTVAQLIHDDDPVLAASAAHFARRHGLGVALADDLRFVLAHRSDAIVLEAARRALPNAAPAIDDTPAIVDLVDRLGDLTLFASVSVDELFRIGGSGRLTRVADGELSRQGAPADEVLFLLEGVVELAGGDSATARVEAPAAINLVEVLEGRPLRHTTLARGPVTALVIDAPTMLTVLADSIPTVQGLFRTLLSSVAALDWMVEKAGRQTDPPADGDLDAVDRAHLLRQTSLFGRATVEQLVDLTAVASDVRISPGEVLWDPGRPPAIYHLLRGTVVITGAAGAELVARPGSTIGAAETLMGEAGGRRAVVREGGRALRLEREPLFEVLAEHGDLLPHVFSGVLGPADPGGIR